LDSNNLFWLGKQGKEVALIVMSDKMYGDHA